MPIWTEATAKKQLEKDRTIAGLGQVGARIKGTSGRCTLAVDQETYIKTVERNGGVQPGGKTIFDSPEFVNDMKRKHDHLRDPGEAPPRRSFGRPSLTVFFRSKDGAKITLNRLTGRGVIEYMDGRQEVYEA